MPLMLLTLALAARLAAPHPPADLRGEPLMSALKAGGYTIVLRHARTDRSFQEPMGYVPASRVQQRNLNDDGVRDARLMGSVFRKYAIPFSEIIASPMFRTMETAEYAVGPATPTMVLRTFPATEEQRKLIAVVPRAGTNRLLVTHHFVIETWVPGIRPGDIGESEAAVVHTGADGAIELVGKILLTDWRELSGGAQPAVPQSPPPGHGAPAGHGAPPAAAAPIPSGPVSWPDTPVGALARKYVEVFSAGNTVRMREFITSSLVVNPARPLEERIASYEKLFADYGPIDVFLAEAVGPREVRLTGQTRKGRVEISVRESEEQPGRASSITLRLEGGQE